MKTSTDICAVLVLGLLVTIAVSRVTANEVRTMTCDPSTIQTISVSCVPGGCAPTPSGDVIASISNLQPFPPGGTCVIGRDLIPVFTNGAIACSAVVTSCTGVSCCECGNYALSRKKSKPSEH